MRYTLRAPVDGNLVLQYPNRRVSTTRHGVELALEIGEKGSVSHAIASIQVSEDKVEAFRSSTGPGQRGTAFTLNIGGDKELYELLLAALQDLELDLAFAEKLFRIAARVGATRVRGAPGRSSMGIDVNAKP